MQILSLVIHSFIHSFKRCVLTGFIPLDNGVVRKNFPS